VSLVQRQNALYKYFCGEKTREKYAQLLVGIRMSKRELAQILEQQEWHDRTRWNEDGTRTPTSSAHVANAAATTINGGGEGKERKKRRSVFPAEEEEEEKEEKPVSPGATFLKEEEYFDAGEEEEDDDDEEEEEDDESAKLLREIATSLRALETKVDALIVARSTEKNSKKKKC